jgi:hypothetical protein
MVLVAGSLPMAAQRLDGCPEVYDPFSSGTAPSGKALDQALRGAGVGLTRDVLTIALLDPRADIRSLAALKLSVADNELEVSPLLKAWASEKDPCTKGIIGRSISTVVGSLAWDRAQHPGDQPRIAPFQTYTPSPSPLVTLTVEQETRYLNSTPTVRITARNQTPLPIAFAWARDPQALFSATVTDPTGAPARIPRGLQWNYQPVGDLSGVFTHSPFGLILVPHEEPSWAWRIGDDFDMSTPGTYHVSLSGNLGYLYTTVCSNTAEVKVGN